LSGDGAELAWNVAGLSLLVVIVVALFICVITLASGLAYMHRFVNLIERT